MRARLPDQDGFVERDGVKVHYEVHGDGGPTLLLLPTWTIVHKHCWKMQVPYLARHHRVVTFDGPGNGLSDRPTDPAAYGQAAQTGYALDVLDATGTDTAVVVSLSQGANRALDLAANHPERVLGAVFVAPSTALRVRPRRGTGPRADAPVQEVEPSRVPAGGQDPRTDWVKYDPRYWQDDLEDFAWFFFGQCLPEPHSTKPIEDGVGWALETSPEVLAAELVSDKPDAETLEEWCGRVRCPVLVVHGDDDRISSLRSAERLAELAGATMFVLEAAGHLPLVRDPVAVNLAIADFVGGLTPPEPERRSWRRGRARRQRVLYISSPIGLGHAQRDLAIAGELRQRHPDVEIDWLAQHPVTRVLDAAGERVHPASRWLVNESSHVESESAEHDLHCFQAVRRMDEILLANFMVFHDLVTSEPYDLVVGDESWDVDYYLHENPELKRFAYAWFTDFVGWLPMADGGPREALVAADHNAEMIGHIARHPRVRDRAIFVGSPDDIVADPFGPDLPAIRDWTEQHYDFAGYVTGFDPAPLADRDALRDELGYRPDEAVCVVTAGGSGVGGDLLRRVIDAFPEAKRRVPALRMVVVCGPRIDPASLPTHDGLEVRSYVHELYRHLACCDLAVVQGGLTTCMELTATGRPFLYVPLRHHFEQNFHVVHRLDRYGAGRRLDFDDLTPEGLADAIASEIGRPTSYRPVESDGAARAAGLLAELL